MREIRYAAVNGKEIPVLISDENEALLAARDGERRLPMRWKRFRT